MAEYIEREAVLNMLKRCKEHDESVPDYSTGVVYASIAEEVELIPSADVVEVRHGWWIEKDDINGDTFFRCSVCEEDHICIEGTPSDNFMDYCPYCGAKMDGDDNGQEETG